MELPDIEDPGYSDEEDDDGDEDLHSDSRGNGGRSFAHIDFVASSIRLQRTSSGSGDSFRDRRHDSDHSDTDSEALDLSAIRRARLQNPGTISMFGSISAKGVGKDAEDEGTANEDKLRKLFDLPASEKIITGMAHVPRVLR